MGGAVGGPLRGADPLRQEEVREQGVSDVRGFIWYILTKSGFKGNDGCALFFLYV